MLVSLFGKCCVILWKQLSYQPHFTWIFLLLLLSQRQQSGDGKPTKWNRSIQRRFLWKQMDSTVDGFVDRVVTGARVMKSMIGDFMPPKHSSSNVMDYLPTETTRIKYIIRNPHTKETKVIRVRPSKKVVKLMAMTPKPLLADKPKATHMSEADTFADKLKAMHLKAPENFEQKFKSVYMIDPDKLRQLEKEQELIAEGRIPITSAARPIYVTYRAQKDKNHDEGIVSGKIRELNESWKPVYTVGDTPTGFTTPRPYMMSVLHTSAMGELLPEPQDQVYEPLTSNHFPDHEPKKSHTYEVTEYAAEESVVQPYTHELFEHLSPQTDESFFKQYPISTEAPQVEDHSVSNSYQKEYRSPRGFSPSKVSYRLAVETSTAAPTTTVTTTTTEEPNYPEIFLKKLRSRPGSNNKPKEQQRTKLTNISIDSNWTPSNSTYTSQNTRKIPYHQQHNTISVPQRTESQKWPPDSADIYQSSEPPVIYDVSSTTEVATLQDVTHQPILSNSESRKNVRLKTSLYATFNEAKHRTVRHRGSVKYGDKLDIER